MSPTSYLAAPPRDGSTLLTAPPPASRPHGLRLRSGAATPLRRPLPLAASPTGDYAPGAAPFPSPSSMFRCSVCGVPVGPGVAAVRVVLQTRPKTYPLREKVNLVRQPETPRERWTDDPGGWGTEIVREGLACPACGTM